MTLPKINLKGVSKLFLSTRATIILCCFFVNTSFAQFYPVQVTPQLIPPYSVYLSDYATPGSEKLRVIVLQRDLTQPAYQLRLTMSVEWNGKVIMRTSRAFNPSPINIDPGIPTIISGADLAPYLNSRNIDFLGYSREQYERTRALPEGSYRIFFTAYDYRRQDVQVSNEGNSFYYLSKSEPPLINFPACGTRIPLRDPQQIIFSWLPRNTSSPTSVAETEYEFSLYETRPAGRNPNDVVLSTQPVFRTRVDFTQLVYGPAEPLLFEGMKYVWRVQAIDKNGRDAFRNNGFSEVCTFTYGGADATFDIGVVKNLQAVGETERRGKISWEAANYDSYRVFYKKTGAGYEWFTSDVKNTELKLFDLEPATEYETRVQVKKSGVFGPYSEIIKFRTTPTRVVQCGQENGTLAQGDTGNPLMAAHKGMTIDVDGMEVMLLDVVPLGSGWYKGMGTVTTKLLGASFHVKFDRLFIDDNLVAGLGKVEFLTKGVAELVQQQLANQVRNNDQKQQEENREEWADVEFQEKIFKYDIIIDEISFENGAVTIIDSEGNSYPNTEIPQMLIDAPEKAIIIEDKNGDQYVVQKDPATGETKATKVEGGGLVVGPDGKIIDNKTLRKLDKMILEALNKYKKAIEDYQTSIKQIQPSKGGGPSLFEDELEKFYADLPTCLESQKDNLGTISSNIDLYLVPESKEQQQFISVITQAITYDFPTEEDKDNVSVERVESEVCEALAVVLSKEFFDSKYVRMHDDLNVNAWASTKGKDAFTQDIVSEVDGKLEILDKEGKLTYILINYAWFDASNISKFEERMTNLSANAKSKLGKELGVSDFNLLVVVNAKYDTALAGGLRGVSFREWFYPMNGLDASCSKAVKDYLNDESKKKFSDGLNDALKERAEKLLEKLKGCKVEKPKEIVIRYKRKGRNEYRTWGEFTIDGTDYKGYILERPKGDNPTQFETDKRVPANAYTLSYSEYSGGDKKFNNVTLYLVDHSGYKLHCGNRVDQSNGCLLINEKSPQFDKYPDSYQSGSLREGVAKFNVANDYPCLGKCDDAHSDPSNPALKLRNKVKEMQEEIERTYKIPTVRKVLIIDETEEKEEQ